MGITNNQNLNRFEVSLDEGTGFLCYRIESDTMHLLYVEVPPEARGHGVAAELSRAALELAKERGLKVVPVCSYVVAYLRRHPEYSEMVRD
jgi:predicted GNAT family acetyltransferase